ncbi:MAG: 50S ribosomal protein L18e [Candidatus Thermoplasmatota archaeon]|nr:50S ribosomal protein L18e [Candidatus Thermoplasmatota archaeon]
MAIEDKTNPNLIRLIEDLKTQARENEAPIWRDVAERLEKPSKNWAEVNLSSLQRNADDGETIVIPGKLLGAGLLTKEITVGAFKASKSAKESVDEAGGEFMDLRDLVEKKPEGSDLKMMG